MITLWYKYILWFEFLLLLDTNFIHNLIEHSFYFTNIILMLFLCFFFFEFFKNIFKWNLLFHWHSFKPSFSKIIIIDWILNLLRNRYWIELKSFFSFKFFSFLFIIFNFEFRKKLLRIIMSNIALISKMIIRLTSVTF